MATEKRLIAADVLYDKLIYDTTKTEIGGGEYISTWRISDAIEEAPTVDAVEVVRCKECRWARPQDHREPVDTPTQALICECFMHHHIPAPWGARLAVKPDGFCSCGERRTNG